MEGSIDSTEMRQQVMMSQFVYVAGCHPEQARQLLVEYNWQFETAMSRFLQEQPVVAGSCRNGNTAGSSHLNGYQYQALGTPANTPVTPPNFPDTLSALARLSAGEVLHRSPAPHLHPSPPPGLHPLPNSALSSQQSVSSQQVSQGQCQQLSQQQSQQQRQQGSHQQS